MYLNKSSLKHTHNKIKPKHKYKKNTISNYYKNYNSISVVLRYMKAYFVQKGIFPPHNYFIPCEFLVFLGNLFLPCIFRLLTCRHSEFWEEKSQNCKIKKSKLPSFILWWKWALFYHFLCVLCLSRTLFMFILVVEHPLWLQLLRCDFKEPPLCTHTYTNSFSYRVMMLNSFLVCCRNTEIISNMANSQHKWY